MTEAETRLACFDRAVQTTLSVHEHITAEVMIAKAQAIYEWVSDGKSPEMPAQLRSAA